MVNPMNSFELTISIEQLQPVLNAIVRLGGIRFRVLLDEPYEGRPFDLDGLAGSIV